jgi:hypothetical protein
MGFIFYFLTAGIMVRSYAGFTAPRSIRGIQDKEVNKVRITMSRRKNTHPARDAKIAHGKTYSPYLTASGMAQEPDTRKIVLMNIKGTSGTQPGCFP